METDAQQVDEENKKLLREQIAHIEVVKSNIKASFKEYSDEQFIVAAAWMAEYMNDLRKFLAEETERRKQGAFGRLAAMLNIKF
jgi:hypothetical protein